jgi:carboxylesterase type B
MLATWRYLFNATYPTVSVPTGSGAFHTSELPFIFGNVARIQSQVSTEAVTLSKTMQTAWADFAKNPLAGPGWSNVGKPKGENAMGEFGSDGKLVVKTSEFVDRWCHHWEMGNMI